MPTPLNTDADRTPLDDVRLHVDRHADPSTWAWDTADELPGALCAYVCGWIDYFTDVEAISRSTCPRCNSAVMRVITRDGEVVRPEAEAGRVADTSPIT